MMVRSGLASVVLEIVFLNQSLCGKSKQRLVKLQDVMHTFKKDIKSKSKSKYLAWLTWIRKLCREYLYANRKIFKSKTTNVRTIQNRIYSFEIIDCYSTKTQYISDWVLFYGVMIAEHLQYILQHLPLNTIVKYEGWTIPHFYCSCNSPPQSWNPMFNYGISNKSS
jgi:hypothetical protein